MASLSPEIAGLTLVVGSVGKDFYATAWRVGFLIGPEDLVKHVCNAHTRVCFVSPGPPQEAAAVGYEMANEQGFWEKSRSEILAKMTNFNEIWDELGLAVSL
jgi:kynurenine aminotransferase